MKNREIKFRAWDGEKMVFVDGYGLSGMEVMEFTGLHDRNGKEIYEGDILNLHIEKEKEPLAVSFRDGSFCIGPIVELRTDKYSDYISLREAIGQYTEHFLNFCEIVEVIGNIYEKR